MALIKCPECGKGVSDQAVSCPNCGYILRSDSTVQVGERTTSIGEVEKAPGAGAVLIVLGIICLIGCLIIAIGMPGLGWIIAIFAMIAASVMINGGINCIKGKQAVQCPACGKAHYLVVGHNIYHCPYCKVQSIREIDHLKEIK